MHQTLPDPCLVLELSKACHSQIPPAISLLLLPLLHAMLLSL